MGNNYIEIKACEQLSFLLILLLTIDTESCNIYPLYRLPECVVVFKFAFLIHCGLVFAKIGLHEIKTLYFFMKIATFLCPENNLLYGSTYVTCHIATF